MIPTTFLSLHDITGLKAIALQSLDTPLVLRVDGEHGMFQISLYGLAADRVERIADAINSIMLEPAPAPVVLPVIEDDNAHAGLSGYYEKLKRDLDRDPIEEVKAKVAAQDAQRAAINRMHGIL